MKRLKRKSSSYNRGVTTTTTMNKYIDPFINYIVDKIYRLGIKYDINLSSLFITIDIYHNTKHLLKNIDDLENEENFDIHILSCFYITLSLFAINSDFLKPELDIIFKNKKDLCIYTDYIINSTIGNSNGILSTCFSPLNYLNSSNINFNNFKKLLVLCLVYKPFIGIHPLILIKSISLLSFINQRDYHNPLYRNTIINIENEDTLINKDKLNEYIEINKGKEEQHKDIAIDIIIYIKNYLNRNINKESIIYKIANEFKYITKVNQVHIGKNEIEKRLSKMELDQCIVDIDDIIIEKEEVASSLSSSSSSMIINESSYSKMGLDYDCNGTTKIFRYISQDRENLIVKKMSYREKSFDYESILVEIIMISYLQKSKHIVKLMSFELNSKGESSIFMPDNSISLKFYIEDRQKKLGNLYKNFQQSNFSPPPSSLYDCDNGITLFNHLLQITEAIEYMHSHNILHGDIKPDNILINNDNTIKLIDFGLTIPFFSINHDYNILYSIHHRDPNVILRNKRDYNLNLDIFALGCTLYNMITLNCLLESKDGIQQNYYNKNLSKNENEELKPLMNILKIYNDHKIDYNQWKTKISGSPFWLRYKDEMHPLKHETNLDKINPFYYDIIIKCIHPDTTTRISSNQLLEILNKSSCSSR